MPVRVAVCQAPDIQEDIERSLYWMRKLARQAVQAGAAIVVFPECYLQGYLTDEWQARKHALDLNDDLFATVTGQLGECKAGIVFGLIEQDAGKLYNTAVVVKNGLLLGRYQKTFLLAGEKIFTPGTHYPVFHVDGICFGINICYDTQFPVAAHQLAEQGVQLILCPSNTMMPAKKAEKFKHLHAPMRAERAQENKVWLMSSDVVGQQEGRVAYGSTSVIDPSGAILQQVPFGETGFLIADIA